MRIGSLFAGIGGFELGFERGYPESETLWQVEQNQWCRSILRKHWKNTTIYEDIRDVGKHNLKPVDIILGGFPCQDISISNKNARGLDGKRSGLWWEMHRVISELRPRYAVLENVPNVIRLGGREVVGSLTTIGYDCEWTIISARQFNAPHKRSRWFCIAKLSNPDTPRIETGTEIPISVATRRSFEYEQLSRCESLPSLWNNKKASDWDGIGHQSSVHRMDDGLSHRVDRIRGLGNSIVPAQSEYIARQLYQYEGVKNA